MKLPLPKLAAFLTVVLPACCLAASGQPEKPAQAVPEVQDVALARGGLLQGQVVDAKGTAMKAIPVSVWFNNQQVAKTVSDDSGRFTVTGLRGGVHQVTAGQGAGVYRLWTVDAAPPSATSGAVVVPGEAVVRGQNGYPVRSILESPVLWGGLMYTVGHIIGFNVGIDHTPSSP
jgi:hypothetical protein